MAEPTSSEPETMLTVDQAAARLGVSRATVFAMIRRGELGAVPSERTRAVPLAAVETHAAGIGRTGGNDPRRSAPPAPLPLEALEAIRSEVAALRSEVAALRQERAELPMLLTVEQTADLLGISTTMVRNEVRSGGLPSVLLGRARRIRRSDLERYVDALTG